MMHKNMDLFLTLSSNQTKKRQISRPKNENQTFVNVNTELLLNQQHSERQHGQFFSHILSLKVYSELLSTRC